MTISRLMLLCVHAKSLQSCSTLCEPMDHSLPGSSVQRIFRARVLERASKFPSYERRGWSRLPSTLLSIAYLRPSLRLLNCYPLQKYICSFEFMWVFMFF